MKYAIYLIAAVIALGMAAVAGHESEAATDSTELQEAAHSRAWVLEQFQRNVCRPGETAVWVADKEADCLREVRP